jgi:Secretion system C-terminal sorting domain
MKTLNTKAMKKMLLLLGLSTSLFSNAQTSCSGAFAFGAAPPIGTQSCLTGVNVTDATLSTMSPATACGAPNREFWMSFTVSAATAHSFIFDMTDGTGSSNVGFQILSATTVCNATNWTGTILDCDNDAASNNPETETLYNLPNGTYYVRMLSYNGNTSSSSFCLTGIADPPVNDNPCSAIAVPVGANGACTPTTATNVGATATSGPTVPSCTFGYSGGDTWYSVVVPASGNITFATDYASPATITDNGIAVYSGACGSLTEIGCDDDSGNGLMASLALSGLTPGTTLYVRVWEYGNDVSGTFTMCFSEPVPPDANQDCNTANQLCSDATLSGASNGSGSVVDLNTTNEGCLYGENEANWYFMVVTTAGLLEFNVSPNNGSDDYDFAVWRYPGGVGQTCPPTATPTRCSFAAGSGLAGSYDTGLGSGAVDATEDSSGDNWVQGITCAVGDIVVMLIDNFSSTTSPFTLDFTGNVGLSCVPVSLPVTLLGLNGVQENGVNKISWSTEEEINSDYYVVERKVGEEWIAIAKDFSKSGAVVNEYVIYDADFDRMETNYYRLKQVDNDGDVTDLGIIAIQSEYDFSDVVLSPNPAKDQLNVSLNATKNAAYSLSIVDMSGKQLFSQEVSAQEGANSFQLNVDSLKQGSYLLVVNGEATVYRKSFMK